MSGAAGPGAVGLAPAPLSGPRRRPRLLRRLLLLLLAAAAASVAGAAAWVVLWSPWLAVDRVVVAGTARLPVGEVRAAAGVRPGTPLARIDTGEVQRRVARLAPVRAVRVERSWPGTLRLVVTERRVAAAVVTARGVTLVDEDGVAVERVVRLPAGTVRLQVHRPGPRDPATRSALGVLGALPDGLRRRTAIVHAVAPDAVVLRLRDGRQVVWGDGGRTEEKAVAAEALLRLPGRWYDVSSPEVVVRR